MKIALDLRFASLPGGGFVYADKLIPALIRLYPQVRWLLYHNPHCPAQQDIITRHALHQKSHVRFCPVRSACLSLKQHLEFLSIRDDADLYHYLHFDMPLGIRRGSLVLTVHDLYPLTVPNYCSLLKQRYFYHLTKYNVRRAAAVIAISNYTKQDIIQYFAIPPEKIHVIPQSQSRHFHPCPDPQRLRCLARQYQLPPTYIFYTGNHKPHKNLPRLIQAYALLSAAARRKFPLLLTGAVDAPAQELLELARQNHCEKDVRFLGWVPQDDLPGLYELAALVVLPSLYEGFGLAPLEAFACGAPVACSNAAAIPEVVGSHARLFDPYDIGHIRDALADALEYDLDNPAARQARMDHAALFSEERTAHRTCELYQQLIG